MPCKLAVQEAALSLAALPHNINISTFLSTGAYMSNTEWLARIIALRTTAIGKAFQYGESPQSVDQ